MCARRALAVLLAVYIAAGTAMPVWASASGPKTTVGVADARPDYLLGEHGGGREFDYDDGEVAVKLRASGTARLFDAEYGEDADRFDAGAGFGVLVPYGFGISEDAAVELVVERRGRGDAGYGEVVAEAGEAYDDVYDVVGLAYKFYLDGHELDMSGCTVEIRAGWGADALDRAFDSFAGELDVMDDAPGDLGLYMSAYVMSNDGPVLADSGSAPVGMSAYGVDGSSDDGMLDIASCMDMAAVGRVEADVAVLPESDIPMAELPEEGPGFLGGIANAVASFFNMDDGTGTTGDGFVDGTNRNNAVDNGGHDLDDVKDAPDGDDFGSGSGSWIVVNEWGTWLVIGSGLNPEYVVEYWTWLPKVDTSGNIGIDGGQIVLPVVNTQGGHLPENDANAGMSDDANKEMGIVVDVAKKVEDTYKGSIGTVRTYPVFHEIYSNGTYQYQDAPRAVYVDKVSSTKNHNTNYALSQIWVLNDTAKRDGEADDVWKERVDEKAKEGVSADGVVDKAVLKQNWTIYTKAEMNRYGDDLDMDTRLFKDLSQVKFVNDPDNPDLKKFQEMSPEKMEQYLANDSSTYYILVTDHARIRLVYEPLRFENMDDELLPDSSEGVGDTGRAGSRSRVFDANMYDYWITKGTSKDSPDLWVTNSKDGSAIVNHGINAAFVGSESDGFSAQLVFGNGHSGVDHVDDEWNGNFINQSNSKVFKGCTFGLASQLDANGHIVYAEGLAVPNLFDEDVSEVQPNGITNGKNVYAGDKSAKLSFKQVGDTYTLQGIRTWGETDPVELSGLDEFEAVKIGWRKPEDQLSSWIWSNNFWPMDGVMLDTHIGGPKDAKSGKPYHNENGRDGSAVGSRESDDGKDHNALFGMSFSVDFELTEDYRGPLEYLFFGDDDMWVFLSKVDAEGNIRGVQNPQQGGDLVCDIGGVHSAVGEYVDLWDWVKVNDAFEEGMYRLSFFYTERGVSGSTCYMRFTLPSVSQSMDSVVLSGEAACLSLSKQIGSIRSVENGVELDASGIDERFDFIVGFYQEVDGKVVPLPIDGGYTYEIKRRDANGQNDGEAASGPLTSVIRLKDVDGADVEDAYLGLKVALGQGDQVEFTGLPVGTKYVVMETASVGYLPNVILNGTLDNDGQIHGSGAQVRPDDGHVTGTLDKTGQTVITYVNEVLPGYEFPATGGSGPEAFVIVGLAVILVGVGAMALHKRRGMRF